ncbi:MULTISPECIES: polysaccharide lyase family 7 protein [unclassified Lebetimonas]|uniref:polysaccharide lyase family 7 protein n=1 Tax=unclassified Lebetimonas TaxID=2648158 RepID=UPI000467A7B1|nr:MULTISPECIES: polysaccharide lyase family 7 protein [unclassified Lebetimonas]
MKKLILFLSVLLFAHDSPYSLDKFKPILNNAKLQAPTSKYNPLYSVKYGKFNAYENKYFYLQDNDLMVFYMCKKHNRSELRFKNNWYINDNKEKILYANLKIFPLNSNEFTFLQIHSDNNLCDVNKPLLRVAFIKKRNKIKNSIWAIIRVSPYENGYKKIFLGKNEGFMKIKILKNAKNYDNKENL